MNGIFIIPGTSTAENNDCKEVYDDEYSDEFDIVYFIDVILYP